MKAKPQEKDTPKLLKRVVRKQLQKRGGSSIVCSEYTAEQFNVIKSSQMKRAYSESGIFQNNVQDLCFSFEQIQVISKVAERNFDIAYENIKLEKGSPKQPIKSQHSNSSQETGASDGTDGTDSLFKELQYPIQYPLAYPIEYPIEYQEHLSNISLYRHYLQ